MPKFIPLLLAALVLALPAAAQPPFDPEPAVQSPGAASSPWVYRPAAVRAEELRNDLRIMLGIAPLFADWDGARDWDDGSWSTPAEAVLYDKYDNSFFGRHCLFSLSLLWSRQLSRSWEVGATFSYAAFYDGLWRNSDNRKVETLREYNLTFMPSVRYLWMNRRLFRLYTGAELGLQLGLRRGFFEERMRRRVVGTGQFTFLGLTVGRKFYFSAELGVGCRGVVNMGMGWRFDGKNRRR